MILNLAGAALVCVYSKELPICFSTAHAGVAVNLLHACVNLGEASGTLEYPDGNFEEIHFFPYEIVTTVNWRTKYYSISDLNTRPKHREVRD
jgi:hypothetical protein